MSLQESLSPKVWKPLQLDALWSQQIKSQHLKASRRQPICIILSKAFQMRGYLLTNTGLKSSFLGTTMKAVEVGKYKRNCH